MPVQVVIVAVIFAMAASIAAALIEKQRKASLPVKILTLSAALVCYVLIGFAVLLFLLLFSCTHLERISYCISYILFFAAFALFILLSGKICKRVVLTVLAGALIFIGIGIYERMSWLNMRRIPTVSVNEYLYQDYQPFTGSEHVVRLDSVSLSLTEDLPRLDGATALYPIYASFAENVYPQGDYPWYQYNEPGTAEKQEESLVVCSKTGTAYQRLIEGKTDIIFAAGPSAKQREAAEEAGVELVLTPIGKEAFVFFVNAENPVDGLTIEQIQDIYSGKLTRWDEVGGKNEAIRAFQRDEGSGSQTALERLMEGRELIEPLQEDVISGMGGIITQTADYRNYGNALGFSFRYYSTEMVQNNQIKLLALNGVMPSKENIINDTYPISNVFYAVTLKNNDNPNIPLFLKWILSEEGQRIVDEVGYVSLLTEK